MSQARNIAIVGGTLIDGTGSPPIPDSIILIEGERIAAVGEQVELEVTEGAEIIDASGGTVLPGLIDAHHHFLRMGIRMITTVDLSGTGSIKEALGNIEDRVSETEEGGWILGRGWDDSKWDERRYIDKGDLDPISPVNPVVLTRICGHMKTLNSKAMEIAGINRDTRNPQGGQVDKTPDGDPTGVLRDAGQLIDPFIPQETEEQAMEGLKEACNLALRLGCTGVHDAELNVDEINAYKQALEEGILKVRVNMMWKSDLHPIMESLSLSPNRWEEMLRLGPAKLLIDGSLGARTAALYEPYEDDISTKGLTMMTEEELTKKVKAIHGEDSQVAVHAIGDYAIDLVLNAIEAALREQPRKDHRHRIEHCELLSTNQIERIHRLGVIASMQPNFAGEWSGPEGLYEARLGERRLRQNNPYRLLLDEGVRMPFGSDGMPFDPLYGIHSAVNHPIKDSRISIVEAVKGFTLDAAYASFEEDIKGSIEPGKLADITILGKDLTEVSEEEIRDVPIRMTMVGGEILYPKG
ncbi:MAG: amidohydrolase [Candidatus Bathyarchaeota archaeon]|jgi:predicted amidohydrolase YtcJ